MWFKLGLGSGTLLFKALFECRHYLEMALKHPQLLLSFEGKQGHNAGMAGRVLMSTILDSIKIPCGVGKFMCRPGKAPFFQRDICPLKFFLSCL